jgi:hypothetical protein
MRLSCPNAFKAANKKLSKRAFDAKRLFIPAIVAKNR